MNARIPERLDRELALYVARHRTKKQDAVAEAIRRLREEDAREGSTKKRVEFPVFPSQGDERKIPVFSGEELDEIVLG